MSQLNNQEVVLLLVVIGVLYFLTNSVYNRVKRRKADKKASAIIRQFISTETLEKQEEEVRRRLTGSFVMPERRIRSK